MVARRHQLVSKTMRRLSNKQGGSQIFRKCPRCGKQQTIKSYLAVKCIQCGYSIKDFGQELQKGWKLKITYDKENEEITILGNAAGLEFLAGACLAVIGKTDPSGHIHLQWQMNNLLEDSTETRLEFSDDEEDYKT